MSSFEWMELQTLASEIAASRSRLSTARANKNRAMVRALEEEITEAEQRRTRLLAQITSQLASTGTPEHISQPETEDGAEPKPAPIPAPIPAEDAAAEEPAAKRAPVAEPEADEAAAAPAVEQEAGAEMPSPEPAPPVVAAAAPAAEADSAGGGIAGWGELSPNDLDQARGMLATRRAEMLARHIEELKELEADLVQLGELERAIDVFARKFNLEPATGAVVQLDEERELRLQNSA